MLTYFPIDPGVNVMPEGDVLNLRWEPNSLVADFSLADDDRRILRVRFERQAIVRIVDEMPLSTEDTEKSGLVPNHFAYRLEGSPFLENQSWAWREVEGRGGRQPIYHFRFITGWACLDVLTAGEPEFALVNQN